MEERNLEFIDTYTVEEFKNKEAVNKISVVRNPNTGLTFFAYGKEGRGKVTSKPQGTDGNMFSRPVISWCRDNSSGEEFYLLHEESKNTNVLCKL